MSVGWLTFATALVLEVGLLPGTAHAQVQLELPADCGSQQQFLDELAQLVGSLEETKSPLQISLRGGSAGQPFNLRVSHDEVVRELQDADCIALFRSAVVIAATQLRGASTVESPEPAPSEAPSPAVGAMSTGSESNAPLPETVKPRVTRQVRRAPPLTTSAPAPRRASTPSKANDGPHVQLGLALGVQIGETPGVSPALEAHVALEGSVLGARLAWFGLSGGRQEREARGVRVYEWGARGLFTLRPARPLYAAAGASVGRFVGVGRNLGASESAGVWDVAPMLEVGVSAFRGARVSLDVALSGKWSVIRPRFEVSGSNFAVYQVPALGAGLWLRGSWRVD